MAVSQHRWRPNRDRLALFPDSKLTMNSLERFSLYTDLAITF